MIVGRITAITRMNSTAWPPRMLERLPIDRNVDGYGRPERDDQRGEHDEDRVALEPQALDHRWPGSRCLLLLAVLFDGSGRSG